jgi:hypothetical protein
MKTVSELTIYDAEGNPVQIKVQRPRILSLASQGKIPNALMGVATKLFSGKNTSKSDIKETAQMIELYCRACMVEPAFEEMQGVLDDENMWAIFSWATSDVKKLSNFRSERKDGTNNNNGEVLPEKAV